MRPEQCVLLLAIRDLARHSENASGSLKRTLGKHEDSARQSRQAEHSDDSINQKTAHIRRGGFDMFRGILALTLSLCLGAAAAPPVVKSQTTARVSAQ
jgi:hypothetical protein